MLTPFGNCASKFAQLTKAFEFTRPVVKATWQSQMQDDWLSVVGNKLVADNVEAISPSGSHGSNQLKNVCPEQQKGAQTRCHPHQKNEASP